jgi:hypothetical protein
MPLSQARAPAVALSGLVAALLAQGVSLRFVAQGNSMHPFIRDRDVVTVVPLPRRPLCPGEVVAFRHPQRGALLLHRIREVRAEGFLVQGDNLATPDGVAAPDRLLGLVVRAERNGVQSHDGTRRPGLAFTLFWLARVCLSRAARHLAEARRAPCESGARPL